MRVGSFLRNIWSDLCGLACGCVWGMIPVTVQHNTEGGRGWRIRWVLTGERVDAGGEAESHTGSYPPRCFHLAATARLLLLRSALYSSSSWRTCLRLVLIWRLSSRSRLRSWRLRRSWRKEEPKRKKTVPSRQDSAKLYYLLSIWYIYINTGTNKVLKVYPPVSRPQDSTAVYRVPQMTCWTLAQVKVTQRVSSDQLLTGCYNNRC